MCRGRLARPRPRAGRGRVSGASGSRGRGGSRGRAGLGSERVSGASGRSARRSRAGRVGFRPLAGRVRGPWAAVRGCAGTAPSRERAVCAAVRADETRIPPARETDRVRYGRRAAPGGSAGTRAGGRCSKSRGRRADSSRSRTERQLVARVGQFGQLGRSGLEARAVRDAAHRRWARPVRRAPGPGWHPQAREHGQQRHTRGIGSSAWQLRTTASSGSTAR